MALVDQEGIKNSIQNNKGLRLLPLMFCTGSGLKSCAYIQLTVSLWGKLSQKFKTCLLLVQYLCLPCICASVKILSAGFA